MGVEEAVDDAAAAGQRILIVDDERAVRDIISRSLEKVGHKGVRQAESVAQARQRIAEDGPFALVLLDIRMPGEPGTKLLDELAPLVPHTVVIMATGSADIDTAVAALKAGAYDYLVKPLIADAVQLAVARALRKRRFELAALERQKRVQAVALERAAALQVTRHALLEALCHMAEFRDAETGAHLRRIPEYTRILARDMAQNSPYADRITERFIARVVESSPLHDIGKVAVPDAVLLKPGPLSSDEFRQIALHTVYGRDICLSVKSRIGRERSSFIDAAVEITASHHERWDGTGYPQGLEGADIPLAGRIVHLADFYDACRSPRVYRPEPIPRDEVVKAVLESRGRALDPAVVDAFERTIDQFAEVESRFTPQQR